MTGVRAYQYEDKWFTGLKAICKTPNGHCLLANQQGMRWDFDRLWRRMHLQTGIEGHLWNDYLKNVN
jgi:hypothetical protein